MKIALIIIFGIIAVMLLTSYICFRMAFYASGKKPKNPAEYDIPPGRIYEPYRDTMIEWMKQSRQMPCQEFCITSFDGLKLYAKYYECKKDAVTEIMMHGYRGNAERDLCGGIQRAFALGRNVLLVDQRTAGKSDGHVISFGVNESRDCLAWVDFMTEKFGKNRKLILTGISMGASTVMVAAGEHLPENVVGVLADCGFTSPREIIRKVISDMHLPPSLLYPFVRLGAFIFGGFDLEKYSCEKTLANCRIPVIFFHGDDDRFVPCEMSEKNYAACASPKKLVLVKGAGHGMAFLLDEQLYLENVAEFFTQNGVPTIIQKQNV